MLSSAGVESTGAGNGNNVIEVELLIGISFAIISFVLIVNPRHANR